MSGHSKWATTKHKKAIIDGRRAKTFAKLIKGIEVAARTGGIDVAGNPTLFDAITKAKRIQFHLTISTGQSNVVAVLNQAEQIGKQLCMRVTVLMGSRY